MTADLKKAYFERDLTETEEDRLAGEISLSREAALCFAGFAKAAYIATGLPKPDWSSTASGGGAAGTTGTMKWLILGALLLAGIWWACTRNGSGAFNSLGGHPDTSGQALSTDVLVSQNNPSQVSDSAGLRLNEPKEAGSMKRANPAMENPTLPSTASRVGSEPAAKRPATSIQVSRVRVAGGETVPSTSARSPLNAPQVGAPDNASIPDPAGQLKPPGMAKPELHVTGKKYDGLNISVSQRSTGLVTVRVLDMNGKEVRLLYAGMLKPGEWNFAWEGRLEDGSPASPGIYEVETQSGPAVLHQKVRIGVE